LISNGQSPGANGIDGQVLPWQQTGDPTSCLTMPATHDFVALTRITTLAYLLFTLLLQPRVVEVHPEGSGQAGDAAMSLGEMVPPHHISKKKARKIYLLWANRCRLCSNRRESRMQGIFVGPVVALRVLAGAIQRPVVELPLLSEGPVVTAHFAGQADVRKNAGVRAHL
jgi:hypothetical protein